MRGPQQREADSPPTAHLVKGEGLSDDAVLYVQNMT